MAKGRLGLVNPNSSPPIPITPPLERPTGRRGAYAYASMPRSYAPDAEARVRSALVECGGEHGVHVRNVFIDYRDEAPYGFAALRELLRRRGDVHALVLPDLTHVAHIASVAGLTHAGLARYLGVAVLVITPTPDPTPPTATIRPLP